MNILWYAAWAGLLTAIGLSTAQAQSTTPPSMSTGTAFAIADGLIYATNYHVVEGARTVCLRRPEGSLVPAQVLAVDKADDLALLKTEFRSPPLALAGPAEIQRGMSVLTIGFPHPTVMGLESKVTDGIVNSLTGIRGDQRRFQISTPIQPGNSGGPLISDRGNVLGVVVSKLGMRFAEISGDIPNNVGYAIHAARLRALMETTPELRSVAGPAVGLRPKDRVALVSQAEKSVALVVASTDREDCATSSRSEPGPETAVPRPNQPPQPGGPSAQERRRQLEAERARIEEEERRRKEAAEAQERAQEEKRRQEAHQARIARDLQAIASNWRDVSGSLGLALWRQAQPSGQARATSLNNLTDDDVEVLRQLRDFLQAVVGQQFPAGAPLPLSASELIARGIVKACGRVERIYRDANYFIATSALPNSFGTGYIETDAGWRSFGIEKRTGYRLSALIPQGATQVAVGSDILATRCD